MTREEICECLKTIITQIDETVGNRYEGVNATYIADIKPNSLRFVIEEAIKVLEQESCEDAISRQSVETLVDELARAISDERCCVSRGRSTATIMQDILDLPSVNPKELKTSI